MQVADDGNGDIIGIALSSGAFSDEQLVDQLMTFLAAGHETTATAMTWILYHLAKNPDIQAVLRNELTAVIPPNAKSVTAAHLDGLHHLHAVCNEALRLHPPVALTVRVTVQDTTIAGYHIPKGTNVTLSPWAVNAAAEHWGKDAAEFRPERWLGAERLDRAANNFSFMTFLHGPRSCIGEKFARGELTCLIAAWVMSFDTRLLDADFVPQIRAGITVKPLHGLPLKVQRIDM
jgi:cytochrome P450